MSVPIILYKEIKMIIDGIKATGLVSFVLTDENGNVKQQLEKNSVVDVGLAHIAGRLYSNPTAMSHMAIGTGTTAVNDATDTTLGSEVTGARVVLDSTTNVTTNVTNDTVQYVATFNPGVGTAAITEAGIFNSATQGSGILLARTVFPVINKGDLDTLTITWKITIA